MARNLEVLDLDFDEIKQNLITFMQDHPDQAFVDYDFDGAALNTLIDALAYTIHYTGMYANLSLNESFLDTAILRKSVVSKAKEIGYVPTQYTGALSEFKLTFDYVPLSNNSGKAVFPRGTKFLAENIDSNSLSFVLYDDNYFYEQDPEGSNIYEGIAHVVQGQFLTQTWTAAEDLRYIINQPQVSTKYMLLKVDNVLWNPSTTFVHITPTSETYFISEVEEGQIEIYFGNDILGKAVASGSKIEVEFLINKGSEGNYLSNFSITKDIFLSDSDYVKANDIVISDVVKSYDGSNSESIESIKQLAPLDYQRQNRVVTIEDYKTAVLSNYNNIQAINAWGGENNIPPEYGKVFLSVKPKTGEKVSATVKTDIERNILSKYGVVGILPEIIDPDYISINLNSIIYYNKDQTNLNTNQLISLINATISNFFENSVFDYETSFKYSNLLSEIDESEYSIISNETLVMMSKYFVPIQDGLVTYYINFRNPIVKETIESKEWTNIAGTKSSLKDDGKGNINLYVNGVFFKSNIGTVDYENGNISLLGFNAEPQTSGERIYINAKPENLNVDASQNNIIILGVVGVTVEPVSK